MANKHSDIVIRNVIIRRDEEGRYCLNDLYKAAGSPRYYRPEYWARSGFSPKTCFEMGYREHLVNIMMPKKYAGCALVQSYGEYELAAMYVSDIGTKILWLEFERACLDEIACLNEDEDEDD